MPYSGSECPTLHRLYAGVNVLVYTVCSRTQVLLMPPVHLEHPTDICFRYLPGLFAATNKHPRLCCRHCIVLGGEGVRGVCRDCPCASPRGRQHQQWSCLREQDGVGMGQEEGASDTGLFDVSEFSGASPCPRQRHLFGGARCTIFGERLRHFRLHGSKK